jgi:hypothetical protein
MANYRTSKDFDEKLINSHFLANTKIGKLFLESKEGKIFFESKNGYDFIGSLDKSQLESIYKKIHISPSDEYGYAFLSTYNGKLWLSHEVGKKWYKKHSNKWIEHVRNTVKSREDTNDSEAIKAFETLIYVFIESGAVNKVSLLECMLVHGLESGWLSFGYFQIRFKEIFCGDNGKVGCDLLATDAGIKWIESDEGRKLIFSFGNDFFRTINGQKWLLNDSLRFIESTEGKDWIIREGSWSFDCEAWHYSATTNFLNWILTTPENIKSKFLGSMYAKNLFLTTKYDWFEEYGEDLFEKKIIGGHCDSFGQYKNDLKKIINEKMNGDIVELFTEKEEEFPQVNFLKFILEWQYRDFWLSFKENQTKFKECFCDEDGSVGYNVLMKDCNKEWIKSKSGRKMMSFIGNQFLTTKNGITWLFGYGDAFMNSDEGKEWILREGTWVFDHVNWHIENPREFFVWIRCANFEIQKKFFQSYHAEYYFMNICNDWFEEYGEYLYDQKIIGERYIKQFDENNSEAIVVTYSNFEEYKNDLIKDDMKMEQLLAF